MLTPDNSNNKKNNINTDKKKKGNNIKKKYNNNRNDKNDKDGNKDGDKKPFPFKCHYCKKEGHMQKDCFKKKRDDKEKRESANTAQDKKDEEVGFVMFDLEFPGNTIHDNLWCKMTEDNMSHKDDEEHEDLCLVTID